MADFSAHYLRDQRNNFIAGLPAPYVFFLPTIWYLPKLTLFSDFPGGEGESKCVGRGSIENVKTTEGRRVLGFEKFEAPPSASAEQREFFDHVNRTLEL